MNRITKMALVLLYLFQLMVVFREQLEHMYEVAIESVHKRADSAHSDGHERPAGILNALGKAVQVISKPMQREQIMAINLIMAQAAVFSQYHPPHDHHVNHHDHDRHKDRISVWRKLRDRQVLIANLWERIRAFSMPQQRAELAEPVSRHLSFV